jgi:hypothetical protein
MPPQRTDARRIPLRGVRAIIARSDTPMTSRKSGNSADAGTLRRPCTIPSTAP